jgi:Domain of unknown function (DUF4149)
LLTVINHIRILLLAAWLGAAIYFSAVVAPNVFGVLRSFSLPNANEIAGTIVTHTLSVVNTGGFILGLLLLISSVVLKKRYGRASFILQFVLLVVVTGATGLGEWVIAARMRVLRAAMHGQIDHVPLDDPNRMAFAALHGYSVAALGIAMMAAVLVILLIFLSRGKEIPVPTK